MQNSSVAKLSVEHFEHLTFETGKVLAVGDWIVDGLRVDTLLGFGCNEAKGTPQTRQ